MGKAKTTKQRGPAQMRLYSWGAMAAIAMNFIIGTGILNLPHAVAQAGIGTSVVIILIASISTTILAGNLVDVIARAFALRRAGYTYEVWSKAPKVTAHKPRAGRGHKGYTSLDDLETVSEDDEARLEAKSGSESDRAENKDIHPGDDAETPAPEEQGEQGTSRSPQEVLDRLGTMVPDYTIPNSEEMVVSELMRLFFGRGGFYFFQVTVMVYFFGCIWGYGSVVASSLTSVIPMPFLPSYKSSGATSWVCQDPCGGSYGQYCVDSYWIWICVTLVFSTVMIFFNLSEQKVLQAIFTVCRFLVIGVVILVALISLFIGPFDSQDPATSPPYPWYKLKMWDFDLLSVGGLFSSVTFCQVCHHSIPGIVQPLRQQDHPKLKTAFYVTYLCIFLVTCLISFICGSFFGAESTDLVTLNFATWDGVSWSNPGAKPWWATTISLLIRVLPPIYVLTAIPINSLTLANNITALFPKEKQTNKWVTVFAKLIAVVPAILVSGGLRCLDVIIQFCGLTGFLIVSCPAIMTLVGKKRCREAFGPKYCSSPYTNFTESSWIMWTLLCIMAVGFVITLYTLIQPLVV